MHLIRITELEFQSINASKHASEISDKEGGRIALFEAFHMIHCLVRYTVWLNTTCLMTETIEKSMAKHIPRILLQNVRL